MEKIPTWEKMEASGEWDDYGSMAREFARRHVTAALETAVQKGKITHDGYDWIIDQESILNSYPLENIK